MSKLDDKKLRKEAERTADLIGKIFDGLKVVNDHLETTAARLAAINEVETPPVQRKAAN